MAVFMLDYLIYPCHYLFQRLLNSKLINEKLRSRHEMHGFQLFGNDRVIGNILLRKKYFIGIRPCIKTVQQSSVKIKYYC